MIRSANPRPQLCEMHVAEVPELMRADTGSEGRQGLCGGLRSLPMDLQAGD